MTVHGPLSAAGKAALALRHEHPELTYAEIGRRVGLSCSRVAELVERAELHKAHEEEIAIESHVPLEQRRIENLPFSVRTYNCLRNGRIEFVHELLRMTPKDVLRIKNLGRACLEEIERYLGEHGASLREDRPSLVRVPLTERCPHCGGTGRVQRGVREE